MVMFQFRSSLHENDDTSPDSQGHPEDAAVITPPGAEAITVGDRADLLEIGPGVLILVMEALTGGRVTSNHHHYCFSYHDHHADLQIMSSALTEAIPRLGPVLTRTLRRMSEVSTQS